MAWFRRTADDRDGPKRKVVIAEGLWIKCDSCKEIVYRAEIERAGKVCPRCRYAFRISARERIAQLIDPGSFEEREDGVLPADPLGFRDTKRYRDRVKGRARQDGDERGGRVRCSAHRRPARPCSACSSSASWAGAWARSWARRSPRSIELAIAKGRPVIIVSASGGARMQEGILSLMQMAKTSAALARLRRGGPALPLRADRSRRRAA